MAKGLSHNPERPSYGATKSEYLALYHRIQEAFEPEDMTSQRLKEWANNDAIAGFTYIKELDDSIKNAINLEELQNIKEEANQLLIHKSTILKRIEQKEKEIIKINNKEKEIADSILRTQQFAQSQGIELTDKVIGKEYIKWGRYPKNRKAIVIRKNGKIYAWKYIEKIKK